MFAAYLKSKISIQSFSEPGQSVRDLLATVDLPAAVFRFISFEADDFENKQATVLSFSLKPEMVYVTLKTGDNLDKALALIKELNPHVLWELGALNFMDHPGENSGLVKQQLLIVESLEQ